MRLFRPAVATRKQPGVRDILWAALAAAVIPISAAGLVIWLSPAGCDIRGDPAFYRWTCLLPGLMLTVPVIVAVALATVFSLNKRLTNPVPDGLLVTVFGAGLLMHLVMIGGYSFLLNPAYRGLFLWEQMRIPQPFLAGAVPAAVFWIVLRRRESQAA